MSQPVAISFTAFVSNVLRVKLTPGQRVLCGVAFDGKEPRDFGGADRELARQIFGDVDVIPPEARHVVVAVCGARAGKSYILCALRLLYLALTVDLSTMAPGELAVGLIVAPDLRLARNTLRYAFGAAKRVHSIASLVGNQSSNGFTIAREGGRTVSLECLPATGGGSALRGRSLVGAVLDECAFFRDESYTVNDAEVFKAVAPRVLPGGQVIVASTPWAETGLLFDLFTANHGDPRTALAAHAPTLLLRGDARTLGVVERERERDPDNASREFDAVFMTSGTGLFFDAGAVGRSVDALGILPLAYLRSGLYVAAADFGFRSDSSALVIAHHDGEVYRVADVLELRPQKGQALQPSVVVASFAETMKRYGCTSLISDGHYAEAIREHLGTHGLSFVEAPAGLTGKVETYCRTRALLHDGRIRLPEHARLLAQLKAVTSKPTAGGGLAITSPRKAGSHGDIVSALVLAVAGLPSTFVEPWMRGIVTSEIEPLELAA